MAVDELVAETAAQDDTAMELRGMLTEATGLLRMAARHATGGSVADDSACTCDYSNQPWHDRLTRLEDDLSVVLELIELIENAFEFDFIDADNLMAFVAQHEWRDRLTVARFVGEVASLAELLHHSLEKLDPDRFSA